MVGIVFIFFVCLFLAAVGALLVKGISSNRGKGAVIPLFIWQIIIFMAFCGYFIYNYNQKQSAIHAFDETHTFLKNEHANSLSIHYSSRFRNEHNPQIKTLLQSKHGTEHLQRLGQQNNNFLYDHKQRAVIYALGSDFFSTQEIRSNYFSGIHHMGIPGTDILNIEQKDTDTFITFRCIKDDQITKANAVLAEKMTLKTDEKYMITINTVDLLNGSQDVLDQIKHNKISIKIIQ